MTWIYYDADTARWQHVRIGEGETSQFEETGFKGSGDLDAGRIDGVPMICVAAIEPVLGNTIYTRDPESDPAIARWARQVLDVYGDPMKMAKVRAIKSSAGTMAVAGGMSSMIPSRGCHG